MKPAVKSLFQAFAKLKTAQETEKFLADLCTMKEVDDMADRFEVARLLEKELPYRKISEMTGVSTATITRVAHWLNHGEGGYLMILSRI